MTSRNKHIASSKTKKEQVGGGGQKLTFVPECGDKSGERLLLLRLLGTCGERGGARAASLSRGRQRILFEGIRRGV
jgi:hypothetical protein